MRTLVGSLPLVVLVAVAGATWGTQRDWAPAAWVMGIGLALALTWRLAHPRSYKTVFDLFRRYRRSTRVLRRWRRTMLALGLDGRDGDAVGSRPPQLSHVRTDRLLNSRGIVSLRGVHSPQDLQRATDCIATAMGAERVSLADTGRPQRWDLRVTMVNPLVIPLTAKTWSDWSKQSNDLSRVVIGVDQDGQALSLDLRSEHVLIGGATGSGKSTLLAALIGSLLQAHAALVLCDPKRVELSAWQPAAVHTATEMDAISTAIRGVEAVMDRRYDVMEQRGVRGTIPQEMLDELGGPIFLIIEELSSVVSSGDKSALKSLDEISRKGRAAGIHLICALQSPKAENFKNTGSLRDQLGCQIAARVARTSDSDVILGQGSSSDPKNPVDASEIRLPGEVIIRNAASLKRGRSPLLSDSDVRKLVEQHPARLDWIGLLALHGTTPDALVPEDEKKGK